MEERVRALLVHTRQEPMVPLDFILAEQGVEVEQAASCGEAMLQLWGNNPPHLVFTDTTLVDGSWDHILALAREAPRPVSVVVVSGVVDVGLYLETLDQGACDFLTPPFKAREVAHIVRCAVSDTERRRIAGTNSHETQAQTAPGFRAVPRIAQSCVGPD